VNFDWPRILVYAFCLAGCLLVWALVIAAVAEAVG
jgi:hypothetical protein